MSARPVALAVTGRGLVDPLLPVLAADDEGFTRGRAAFETMRVYGGRPFRYEEHVSRLVQSAGRIGLPVPERTEIDAIVGLALGAAGLADAALRLYWTPGPPEARRRASPSSHASPSGSSRRGRWGSAS